jgi:hypothetical protein
VHLFCVKCSRLRVFGSGPVDTVQCMACGAQFNLKLYEKRDVVKKGMQTAKEKANQL